VAIVLARLGMVTLRARAEGSPDRRHGRRALAASEWTRRGGTWQAEVGIRADTMLAMAMTLRLTEAESKALRRRAEHEGRPMQEVARQAIREYVESHSRAELLDQVLDEELPRYAEALDRLGQ